MVQMNATKSLIVTAGLLGAHTLVAIPAVAQTNSPSTQSNPPGGMMGHEMANNQGRTMMAKEMHQKTSRMMDNCNRTMESMSENKDGAVAPANPTTKG